MDSLGKKPFFMDTNLGRKQEIVDSLGIIPMFDSLSARSDSWQISLHQVQVCMQCSAEKAIVCGHL